MAVSKSHLISMYVEPNGHEGALAIISVVVVVPYTHAQYAENF